MATQIRSFLPSIVAGDPHADRVLYAHSAMLFNDVASRDALVQGARDWTSNVLRPYLDGLDSVEALRRWAITEERLRHCGVARMVYPDYAATLTLARLTSVETLEAYAQAFRRNKELKSLSALFKEPNEQHFEQLVAGLRAQQV